MISDLENGSDWYFEIKKTTMNNSTSVLHGHVITDILKDDGQFPNNETLPILVYKGSLNLHPSDEAECVVDLFHKNNWTNSWQGGIFDYQHYHSNTHEVMGVVIGRADVQLGGPEGVVIELLRSDVIIIPAGVAHKCLFSTDDFLCVGAYPEGKTFDMNYGEASERPEADEKISKVPIPSTDPIYGDSGPLLDHWKSIS